MSDTSAPKTCSDDPGSEAPSAGRSRVRSFGLVAGPVIAVLAYFLLPESYRGADGAPVPLTHAGRATVGLMAWMAIWWVTEAIDVYATALVPLVVLPLVGAATMPRAAAPYANEFIFLFMGGFILALSMQRWGLDRRIALGTLALVGPGPRRMVGGFMLATAALSGFVSNTATAAMMMPVGLGVIDVVLKQKTGRTLTGGGGLPEEGATGRNFALCLMLGIAYGASIGGVATLIGTPPNVFLAGYLRDSIAEPYRQEVSFARWFLIGGPLTIVFLPLVWWLLTYVLYPIRMRSIGSAAEFVAERRRALGKPNAGERITLLVFLLTAVAWMTRPWLAQWVPALSDAGIAMTAALVLFVLPAGRGSAERVMDWETARKLPWGILVLFGGGLSLAASITDNGVAEFLGAQARAIGEVPDVVLVLFVTTAVIFFSELASNTATATALVPILAAMAPGLDVHPYLLVVPATLAASYAFMMPVGTPPNAIVFGTGHVTLRQMIRAGLWLNLLAIVLITVLAFAVVGPLIAAT